MPVPNCFHAELRILGAAVVNVRNPEAGNMFMSQIRIDKSDFLPSDSVVEICRYVGSRCHE